MRDYLAKTVLPTTSVNGNFATYGVAKGIKKKKFPPTLTRLIGIRISTGLVGNPYIAMSSGWCITFDMNDLSNSFLPLEFETGLHLDWSL